MTAHQTDRTHSTEAPPAQGLAPSPECAAYPPLVRVLTVVFLASILFYAWQTLPAMSAEQWNFTALSTLILAGVVIGWVGWWILNSRTRLVNDNELVQTWLWDKQVKAAEVASFKIVHWPWLQGIIAPRIMLRRNGGGITWVHASDASLLVTFGHAVVSHKTGGNPASE